MVAIVTRGFATGTAATLVTRGYRPYTVSNVRALIVTARSRVENVASYGRVLTVSADNQSTETVNSRTRVLNVSTRARSKTVNNKVNT